jgi:hypothetical protein
MDKFEKQTMFSLEDVEHIIEHVLGIDLPDALQKIRKLQTFQEGIRQGTMHGIKVSPSEPCWDCRMMIPELLYMNQGDTTVGTVKGG